MSQLVGKFTHDDACDCPDVKIVSIIMTRDSFNLRIVTLLVINSNTIYHKITLPEKEFS